MEIEDDLHDIFNQVIEHLPAAPDTTGVFLLGAAGSAPSSNGDAAVAGAAVSTDVSRSASSGPSAGPLLPVDVCSPAPSVSAGSGPLLPGDVVSHAPSVPSAGHLLPGDVCSPAPSVSAGSARVLSVSVDADGDAFAPSFYNANMSDDVCLAVSALEGRCFSVLPGKVCSSASGRELLGSMTSDAAASSQNSSGTASSNLKSTAAPIACQTRALPKEAVSFIFRQLPIKSIFRVGWFLSKDWLQVWQAMPLIIHDIQLSPDHTRESIINGNISCLSLARNVSKVLDQHPGPIDLFRIDSTTWRERNNLQWRVWFEKLISKSVKEVIVCGRWPRSPMEMLPNNLMHCKSLQKVHLCFFSLPKITDDVVFPCLQELQLCYCVFESADLENVLRNCNLIKLTLGYIKLGDTLRIESETLRKFSLWSCDIDALCLSGTPSLTFFSQEPSWNLDCRSHLQIRGIPKLRVLLSIYLKQQTVELDGHLIKADMLNYPLCWSVTTLGLVVDFSHLKGLELMPSLLRCFPNLEQLIISRVGLNEDCSSIDWHEMLSSVPCIKRNLNTCMLINGCGDGIEKDLVKTLSGCAAALKEFQVHLNPQYRSGTG